MAPTPDIPDKLRNTLDVLAMVPDRSERIQLLIDLADRFREVPARVATRPFGEEHRVPACESEAFVWGERRPDGTLDFHFAVENPQGVSAKALAAVLQDTLSGQPLDQVAAVPSDVVDQLFGDLSARKAMGLMGMISMVRNLARKAAASPA